MAALDTCTVKRARRALEFIEARHPASARLINRRETPLARCYTTLNVVFVALVAERRAKHSRRKEA